MNTQVILLIALGAIVAITFWRSRKRPVGEAFFVQDGDSILIGQERCRLDGIDAPEIRQPGGFEARIHLTHLIETQKSLGYRIFGRDRYGRLRVRLIGDHGADLNRAMVRDGYARAYARYSLGYLPAEIAARWKSRGLWSKGGIANPEDFRHSA